MVAEIHLVTGVRGANAWLVRTPEGLVLVDTGFPGNGARIVAFLEALGYAPGDLGMIALTHYDPDHAGSAAELRDLTGARVAIHAHDAAVLTGGLTPGRAKGAWRRSAAVGRLGRLGHEVGMAVMARLPWTRATWRRCQADLLLADGDRLPGLRVVHAPGHTAGSVAFATEDGALLTGDAVFGDAEGRAHYPSRALGLDPGQARATAKMLVERGWAPLYPGHGMPILRPGRGIRGGAGVHVGEGGQARAK
jgi:glyoxylase-like metal-dependent hydrolase (beta-lactamase superfamily II)